MIPLSILFLAAAYVLSPFAVPITREPYLYFHAKPEIAEWISAIVDALPLSRQWKIEGTMHPWPQAACILFALCDI